LLTLQEYIEDYASPETGQIGKNLITREFMNIPGEKVRAIVERNLAGITGGSRDFRF
jgi:2-iminoacetate synthase